MAFFAGTKGDTTENKDSVNDSSIESPPDLRKYTLFMIEQDFKKFTIEDLSTGALPRVFQILNKNLYYFLAIYDLNEKEEFIKYSALLKKTAEYFPKIINEIIIQHEDDLG